MRSGPASVSISGPCGRVASTVPSFDAGEVVVAAADDPVADRDGDRSVVDIVAELPLRAELLARRGVDRRARVVVARDQHRLRDAVLIDARLQPSDAAAITPPSVCPTTRSFFSAHCR